MMGFGGYQSFCLAIYPSACSKAVWRHDRMPQIPKNSDSHSQQQRRRFESRCLSRMEGSEIEQA